LLAEEFTSSCKLRASDKTAFPRPIYLFVSKRFFHDKNKTKYRISSDHKLYLYYNDEGLMVSYMAMLLPTSKWVEPAPRKPKLEHKNGRSDDFCGMFFESIF
jgi:hypothetical protein